MVDILHVKWNTGSRAHVYMLPLSYSELYSGDLDMVSSRVLKFVKFKRQRTKEFMIFRLYGSRGIQSFTRWCFIHKLALSYWFKVLHWYKLYKYIKIKWLVHTYLCDLCGLVEAGSFFQVQCLKGLFICMEAAGKQGGMLDIHLCYSSLWLSLLRTESSLWDLTLACQPWFSKS